MLPLFLLFVILPIAEIMLIVNVSDSIGGWNTFFIVVTTAFFGAYFVRQQGFALIQQLQAKLASGSSPSTEMAQGLLLLVAGVLLITPGFITDIIGFLFTLPFSREPIAAFLMKKVIVKQAPSSPFSQSDFSTHHTNGPGSQSHGQQQADGDIIDAEYEDKTEDHKDSDNNHRLN